MNRNIFCSFFCAWCGLSRFKFKSNVITVHLSLFFSLQGFLQLDDTGGQHDPHLRSIRGHHETLEGHNIHMLQNEG